MGDTLVLNLSGPLQSWGGPAVTKGRVDTDREPSERALRGLVAACLGVPRDTPHPQLLLEASFHVETLSPGRVVRDFQTAHPNDTAYAKRMGRVLNKGAKRGLPALWPGNTQKGVDYPGVINRTYLADAQFLVLITGKTSEATSKLHEAFLHPVWTPYLGKRAFPPTFPFILGVFPQERALAEAKARLALVGEDSHG